MDYKTKVVSALSRVLTMVVRHLILRRITHHELNKNQYLLHLNAEHSHVLIDGRNSALA